jgi:hypothetical protein
MMPTSLQSLRHAVRARASSCLGILLLALVLPSLWGTWHRVAHAPAGAVAAAQVKQASAVGDAHAPGSEACRLLDKAACADGLRVAVGPVHFVLGTTPQGPTFLDHGTPVRMVASYAARAPPFTQPSDTTPVT